MREKIFRSIDVVHVISGKLLQHRQLVIHADKTKTYACVVVVVTLSGIIWKLGRIQPKSWKLLRISK